VETGEKKGSKTVASGKVEARKRVPIRHTACSSVRIRTARGIVLIALLSPSMTATHSARGADKCPRTRTARTTSSACLRTRRRLMRCLISHCDLGILDSAFGES